MHTYSCGIDVFQIAYNTKVATFPSGLSVIELPGKQTAIVHDQLSQHQWKELTNMQFEGPRRKGMNTQLGLTAGSETIAKVYTVMARTEPFIKWHNVASYSSKTLAQQSIRFFYEHRMHEFSSGIDLEIQKKREALLVRRDIGLTLKATPQSCITPIHTQFGQEHVKMLWKHTLGRVED